MCLNDVGIMANILIIDDDKTICDTLSALFEHKGYNTTYALTLKNGLEKASGGAPDVVFLDVRMPDGDGLHMLPMIRQTPSMPEVIIITGAGDPDGAELAIKSGAWDYIQKPSSIEAMTLPLVRALQYREEKKSKKPPVALKREHIVGNSPHMKRCLDLLAQAADSEASVLITGETGTGKEVFAKAIHANSSRAEKSLVVVDCTALPETLVESVLFGHEKGAFTGADKAHVGLVKQADGGTLFLDEVGELPRSIQKSFLRVLQEHRFRSVGGKREVESHFRLVSATNRDLDHMAQAGQFRKDLLFRLRSFTFELPPLREHAEDIKELAMYHMAKLCERYGTETKGFSPEFFETIGGYGWPGNVRELVSTLESALVSARDEPTLFPKHLPTHIRVQVARASVGKKARAEEGSMRVADPSKTIQKLKDVRAAAVAQAERRYLQDVVSLTGKNIQEVCRISGLGRARLYGLLKKYGILLSD